MTYKQQSLGKKKAIQLYDSKWWEGKTDKEIVKFQLFTKELCIPFGIFHKKIEKVLGRPIFTHEFGMNMDGIVQEFLGERDAPSFEEVMDLIPKDKRVIISC